MALAEAPGHQPAAVPGIVTIGARQRTPLEVAEELMAALADDPHLVECDLSGMTADTAIAEAFRAPGEYLRHWPGTVVLINAPDPAVRSSLSATAYAEHLLIHAGWDDAALATHRLLPRSYRKALSLPASPTAPQAAREFAAEAMHAWNLRALETPVCQVLGEFVTHAVINADTELAVSLSRVDSRVRIAVTNPAEGSLARADRPAGHPLTSRARRLVDGLATGWGVLPGKAGATLLWAVLARAGHDPPGDETSGAGHVPVAPRHRGPADPDVLAEIHTRRLGRHRRERPEG